MIRRANISDLNKILSIVRSAQLSLRELGIDQWQDGYPSADTIMGDINANIGWVYVDEEDRAVGYAAIPLTGEPAYEQIAADKWHTSHNYVVVHRLCVDAYSRRRGVAIELMNHAAALGLAASLDGFRIDTHRGNIRMLSLIGRLGFEYCGIVRYESGERLAYDKQL